MDILSDISVPFDNETRITRRRSKSVVAINSQSSFVDAQSEVKKTLSCDRIDKLGNTEKIKAPLKKSFQKTIQSVFKMFSVTNSLSKAHSNPDISAQISSSKKKHYSSINESLLHGPKVPATNEPVRRRKVSWANKIDTWLEGNNTLVSSPPTNRHRKVSWADSSAFSQSLDQVPCDDVISTGFRIKPYSSDGNLKGIKENHSPEQIHFNHNNQIRCTDHKKVTLNDGLFFHVKDEHTAIKQVNEFNEENFITGIDNSTTNNIVMDNRNQLQVREINKVNKQNDINNNNNKLNINSNNSNFIKKTQSKKFSFDDIDIDVQTQCDVLQRSLSSHPIKPSKKYRPVDDKENADFVSIEDIKQLIEKQVYQQLDGQKFDSKLVTSWCKDISNSIRDNLKLLTRNKKKVVATTYIGSKVNEAQVHVAVKCQKYMNIDDFITVALEGDDMYIWVTLLLADY